MANAAITVDLNAKIANFETELKKATSSMDRFEKKTSAASSAIKASFGAIGAAVSVGALVSFAQSGIDAADAMNDLSIKLGISVKDLASFKLAAEQSGTSLEGVGNGIARLSKAIGQAESGNQGMADALSRLGITARDPKEAFFQLADATEKITDPTKRAALLSEVLGKSYQDLVPLLSQGGEALRQSAKDSETFSDAMARLAPNADQLNDQLALLKNNMAGVSASILSKIVPSFNEWIATGREVINTGSLLDKVRFFALGNASDEVVGRVRKMAATAEAASKKARESIVKIDTPVKLNIPKLKSTTSKTDPLASIFGDTATAKAAEYSSLMDKINARFSSGKVSATQYAEAVAVLNQKFGKTQTDIFNNASFFSKDSATVDFIKSQQDAINGLNTEIANDKSSAAEAYKTALSNLVADTDIAKTDALMTNIDTLNRGFFEGLITAEQYAQAVDKLTTGADKGKEKLSEMDEFAKNAAKSIQQSMSDFLFDPFSNGLEGMVAGFGKLLQRMIADMVAADLAKRLFGGLSDGGKTGGDGWVGALISLVTSANGNAFANGAGLSAYSGTIVSSPTIFPFAKGAGLMGEAGPEVILPLKRGTNGKLGVQSGGSSGTNITVNVSGSNNAPDVRRAAAQGAREAMGMLGAAKRYA